MVAAGGGSTVAAAADAAAEDGATVAAEVGATVAAGVHTAADGGGVAGRRIVVAGATSASGTAVCAALRAAGAEVVAVGSDAARLAELQRQVPGIATEVCDLADSAAVNALAARLGTGSSGGSDGRGDHSDDIHGGDADRSRSSDDGDRRGGRQGVDGLVHLVGGWVGGAGIPGQSDEGWAAMERSFRTLRNTTRAFYPALLTSPAGRVAFVSSVSVEAPTASGASYTAAKAASESWMRSVADGFRRAAAAADSGTARDSGAAAVSGTTRDAAAAGESAGGSVEAGPGGGAAATVFAVTALVDDRMRAAAPEKTFAGFTDVRDLAAAVLRLWQSPAADLNGARIRL